MSQRDVLENAINLLNQIQGPAKLLYAPPTLPMPLRITNVINPTNGAAATGWTAFGLTRGGINVNKRTDTQVDADLDQLVGEYQQRITNRGLSISTQLAEVFDMVQMGVAFAEGTPTVVSTTGATETMIPLDSGANVFARRRLAIVHPRGEAGRAVVTVLRQVEPAGGDKTWRYDKTDKVSPAAEWIAFPEIATDIPSEDAYGRRFQI